MDPRSAERQSWSAKWNLLQVLAGHRVNGTVDAEEGGGPQHYVVSLLLNVEQP